MVYLSLILPTYNEGENIKKLIPELAGFLKKNRIGSEIIVVDDNSPDRTWEIAEKMKNKYPNVRVIIRKKKEGIGAALEEAYNTAKGEILLSMDADLSLDVKEIPSLLEEIKKGNDLVIGSRYMTGSYFQKKSTAIKARGIISKWGNKYIAAITQTPVSDFSLNFRAMKKDVWKKINPRNKKNFFLAEMIIQAHIKGFRVKSIPAAFRERSYGESKTRVFNQFLVFLFKSTKYAFFLRWLY